MMNDNKEMSRKEKHLNRRRLCYCCDTIQESEDDLQKFTIKNRGYNSIFDGDNFTIQLCPRCAKKLGVIQSWFDNDKVAIMDKINDIVDEYLGENAIDKIIDKFPIENQEYIRNCNSDLMPYIQMDRDDWIKDASKSIKTTNRGKANNQ